MQRAIACKTFCCAPTLMEHAFSMPAASGSLQANSSVAALASARGWVPALQCASSDSLGLCEVGLEHGYFSEGEMDSPGPSCSVNGSRSAPANVMAHQVQKLQEWVASFAQRRGRYDMDVMDTNHAEQDGEQVLDCSTSVHPAVAWFQTVTGYLATPVTSPKTCISEERDTSSPRDQGGHDLPRLARDVPAANAELAMDVLRVRAHSQQCGSVCQNTDDNSPVRRSPLSVFLTERRPRERGFAGSTCRPARAGPSQLPESTLSTVDSGESASLPPPKVAMSTDLGLEPPNSHSPLPISFERTAPPAPPAPPSRGRFQGLDLLEPPSNITNSSSGGRCRRITESSVESMTAAPREPSGRHRRTSEPQPAPHPSTEPAAQVSRPLYRRQSSHGHFELEPVVIAKPLHRINRANSESVMSPVYPLVPRTSYPGVSSISSSGSGLVPSLARKDSEFMPETPSPRNKGSLQCMLNAIPTSSSRRASHSGNMSASLRRNSSKGSCAPAGPLKDRAAHCTVTCHAAVDLSGALTAMHAHTSAPGMDLTLINLQVDCHHRRGMAPSRGIDVSPPLSPTKHWRH